MNTDPSELRPEVITGEVVVAKNPCFHPGDVRKLRVRLFWLLTCPALQGLSWGTTPIFC